LLRLRLVFIISLVILAAVFVVLVYLLPSQSSRTETRKVQIIKGDNEWILQVTLMNDEPRSVEYNIRVAVDGVESRDVAVIEPGKSYTYIRHIYPSEAKEGKVTLEVYREGETEPVEKATFQLD